MADTDKTNKDYQLHKAVRGFYHDANTPIRLITNNTGILEKNLKELIGLCEANGVAIPASLLESQRKALYWLNYGLDEARSHSNAFRDKYLSLKPPSYPREASPFADVTPCERILVVDDDLLTREITSDLVSTRHYQVDRAENGQEAVKLASENQYDLILMDCNMPDTNGFEAAKKILKHETARPPVIVGMTALSHEDYFEPGLEAGMKEFIPKPINQAAIDRVLRKYSPHL